MGATKIMVLRHAEKPVECGGATYLGVDPSGAAGSAHLTTRGWQRAGALITLFAPPWGPKQHLDTPQFLFASNPTAGANDPGESGDDGPSQRPYETLLPLSTMLGVDIVTDYAKKDYDLMVEAALACSGVVLIAWQHVIIPLLTSKGKPGLSQSILTRSVTPTDLGVPPSWPDDATGSSRFDLVWVFDRPSGTGPITTFTSVDQKLLGGDT